MNVASLELCKELYELSGWESTDHAYEGESVINLIIGFDEDKDFCPAYDLGYLIRKLPLTLETEYIEYQLTFRGGYWFYEGVDNQENVIPHEMLVYPEVSYEDQLAKLAIEIIKEGYLNVVTS